MCPTSRDASSRTVLRSLLLCCLSFARTPRSPLFPYTTLFRSHSSRPVLAAPEIDLADLLIGLHFVELTFAEDGALMKDGHCAVAGDLRSEEHTSELQSRREIVCRLLLEKKNTTNDVPDISRRVQPDSLTLFTTVLFIVRPHTALSTLSLHDALPISLIASRACRARDRPRGPFDWIALRRTYLRRGRCLDEGRSLCRRGRSEIGRAHV